MQSELSDMFRNCNILNRVAEGRNVCYCPNVFSLFSRLGLERQPVEWKLFIDSSNKNLKIIFICNGNKYPSVSVAYVLRFKETNNVMKIILLSINYKNYGWYISDRLKVIGLLTLCGQIKFGGGYLTGQN